MSSGAGAPPELGPLESTGVWERRHPGWGWARRNFTLPALITLGGLVLAAGGWLLTLYLAVHDLTARVAALEKAPPPIAPAGPPLPDPVLRQQVADQAERLQRIERNWDDATREAGRRIRSGAPHR